MMADRSSNDAKPRNSKVERVIQEYSLEGMADELVTLWIGEQSERKSLRSLADYLNQKILRAAMEDVGMAPLDGETENVYRLLTDDDVSSGVRTDTETALEREGIDIGTLQGDFVSHQAIHTYLTKYRGVERSVEERDQTEKTMETIQRLNSRLTAVTEKNLENLRNTDRITLGEFDVLSNVQVFCQDCERQYTVTELLESDGCSCQS